MPAEIKPLTLKDLKAILDSFTEEQLSQEFRLVGEDYSSGIGDFEILAEDHINPSGEGIEPVSAYEDSDEDYSDEPIVAPKGTILFYTAKW